MKVELILDRPEFHRYSKNKDPIILFTAYDRADNNVFMSKMNNAIRSLDVKKIKKTPRNIAKESGYPMKEIELNLFEIGQIIDVIEA